MGVTIFRASTEDRSDILGLLARVGLPHEGVKEHVSDFFVARDEQGQLIGCAGLERYDRLGLLRSVGVSPSYRGAGLGSKITAALLDDAAKTGIKEVVLLTTTARDFFARRFGFEEAGREDYDERLSASQEWSLPRCSSAVFMRLRLT
ncbi:MAG TPA: arsenic resistance N-acetyltransferase ArsN2 [Blastocatellia bacterium]|nr:arsenic resistance N-acetyltransferase ArsN2 [Blastocatellia bacterium]